MEKSTSYQQFLAFSAEFFQNEKKHRIGIESDEDDCF